MYRDEIDSNMKENIKENMQEKHEQANLDDFLVAAVNEFEHVKAEIVQARKIARNRSRQVKFERDQRERGHLDIKLAKAERIIEITSRFWKSDVFMRVMDISKESNLLYRNPTGEPSILIWEREGADMDDRFQSLAICDDGGLVYVEQSRRWRTRYRNRSQQKKFFTAQEMASILSIEEISMLDKALTYKNIINFVNRQVQKGTHRMRGMLIDGIEDVSQDEEDDDMLWDADGRGRGRFF